MPIIEIRDSKDPRILLGTVDALKHEGHYVIFYTSAGVKTRLDWGVWVDSEGEVHRALKSSGYSLEVLKDIPGFKEATAPQPPADDASPESRPPESQ